MAKAEKDRDYRNADVKKLSADIGELHAKEDALVQEIKELTEKLAMLADASSSATTLREMEKEENLAQIKQANGGLKAVSEAIGILKTFYKSAAKGKVFAQTAASP